MAGCLWIASECLVFTVKTAGILCIIGIGIGIGLTSWLVCKLHGPTSRSYGRALRWGRDVRSSGVWDLGRRSRSLVAASKAVAENDHPSESLWNGAPRRRRPVYDAYEAGDEDQHLPASALYIDGHEASIVQQAHGDSPVLQWLTDESFVDRHADGLFARQHARPSAHGHSVLEFVQCSQQQSTGSKLATDFTDAIGGSNGDQAHPLWHSMRVPYSNVPSMQSSTRDSGFLEWVPTDLQRSTDDDRVEASAPLPSDVGRFEPVLGGPQNEAVLPRSQWSEAGLEGSLVVAESSADNSVVANVEAMFFSSVGPRPTGDSTDWSVAAWLVQQQQQWPDGPCPPASCTAQLAANGEWTARQHVNRTGADDTGIASSAYGDVNVPMGEVCSTLPKPVQPSVVTAVAGSYCEDVLGNGWRGSQTVEPSSGWGRLSAAADGATGSISARNVPLANWAAADLSENSDSQSSLTDRCSDLSLSEGRAVELPDGGLSLQDDRSCTSHAASQYGADRPWSPTSETTSEPWTDDASLYSAGSSVVTSPAHAAASFRCPRCSSSESPSRVARDRCVCRSAVRAASSTASSVDVDGSTPSPVWPDTIDRLAAIETELSTLKAEMSEIELCLKGFIARDTFDSCYSPERYHKLTRIVLESEHVVSMTSAEIGKAFDILRKYRRESGRALYYHDDASPFTRGSSWPDETGGQERRNSFSDSMCRNRSSVLSEHDIGEKGVSSDDEFISRKNPAAAAGRPSPHSGTGCTAVQRACIKASSSLTNVAAHACDASALCRVTDFVTDVSGDRCQDVGHKEDACLPISRSVSKRGQLASCGHRSAFKALKLVDVMDYRQALSGTRAECVALAKGYECISEELGLSRLCTIEGSIECCALRATVLGALLIQLPLAARLQEAAAAIKAASGQSLCRTAAQPCVSGVPFDTVASTSAVADNGSAAALESFAALESLLVAVDQEVKVLEGCLARHAGSASLQHDVEMLSDLLLGVFNDANRDAMLLNALDVIMALQACQPSLVQMELQPRRNGTMKLEPHASEGSLVSPGHLFWRRLLQNQDDGRGRRKPLATADLCILGEAFGCVLLLLRPARYGQADFASYLPAKPASVDVCSSYRTDSSQPVIALVTEDDERYSVGLP